MNLFFVRSVDNNVHGATHRAGATAGGGVAVRLESALPGTTPNTASGSVGWSLAGDAWTGAEVPAFCCSIRLGVIGASRVGLRVKTAASNTARKTKARPVSPIRTRCILTFSFDRPSLIEAP